MAQRQDGGKGAKDYQREDLNPEFFAACSRHLHGRSRLWLFRYQGTPIAFFLNVWGADENYILLEWGIDRDFEHYRKANLYRAALMLSLKDAISRDKRRMEMGITNYFTKLRIPGARVIPTIYFLRHSTDPVHTATLARMMMHNIQRPTLPDDMSEEFCRWEERIRLDQDGLPEHDIFRKIDRQHKYTGLKLGGVYGFYPRFTGPQRSTVKAAELGEIVLLGTNSYLGLATHPEVVEASAEATRRYGTGCSGSPLLNGTLDLHVSLEQELACFLGKPAAVLCSTGYQSNLAAISALCESGDMIIQDALNHRSLFDAARLSGADFTLYRHNDMDHLARVLRRTEGRRRIIVVDAVFSMEGTVADLATIAELADRHGCRVYVDESHALGVLGPDGRGASAALGVLARMDVVMGTFSKSFASVGGFIAGDRPVVDYIRHNGSGHVFSASLPPAAAAATHAALRVSRREPDRRARVLAAAEYMATGLARQGYQAEYHGTAIVPVILGNPTVAHAGYLRLMRSGVYVNPVAPPSRAGGAFGIPHQLPSRPPTIRPRPGLARVCRPCRGPDPARSRAMKEAINATIQRILRTDRGITANQVLVDDLGFDSLKLFQLITELEDEFDIAISFRDAQNIKTVGDVYTSVAVWFPETAKPAPLGKGTA